MGFGGPPGSAGADSRQGLGGLLQRQFGGGAGQNAFIGGTASGNPLDRLQSFFGQLGVPQSGLQRQGADAIGTMLGQPTPEQRALDISLPQLQAMLTGTGPQFERDLSLANQQGGRFGSSNAILRGEALRNLYNLRNQTANTLGLLSQGAGNANRGLAGQAFQTGQQQAGQADIETQRRLQILMNLLGVAQQGSFNVPTTQDPGLFSQLLGVVGSVVPFAGGLRGNRVPPAPDTSGFNGSGLGNIQPWTPP